MTGWEDEEFRWVHYGPLVNLTHPGKRNVRKAMGRRYIQSIYNPIQSKNTVLDSRHALQS